jgi:hypothetical protein
MNNNLSISEKNSNVSIATRKINVIYCFTSNDDETRCKIGRTSLIYDENTPPEDKEIVEKVTQRGKEIFGTAGIKTKL